MKRDIWIILILVGFYSCKTEVHSQKNQLKNAMIDMKIEIASIETFDYHSLESMLAVENEKTYVINFWATWCKPCVEELPEFEKINKNYKDQNVEVILISLDFPNQVEKKLIPFINKHQIQSKVILMNDPDQNEWIPKISEKWSGSIPATLIYNKKARKFYEQSFTYKFLKQELNKFLKANPL